MLPLAAAAVALEQTLDTLDTLDTMDTLDTLQTLQQRLPAVNSTLCFWSYWAAGEKLVEPVQMSIVNRCHQYSVQVLPKASPPSLWC